MSRSYKKHPGGGDSNNKLMKNYANRKLRRKPLTEDENLQYKSYRKNFQSWNIKDFFYPQISYAEHVYRIKLRNSIARLYGYKEPFPEDEKSLRKLYDKWYRRK